MDQHVEPPSPSDDAVVATNDDASECKNCAVRLGYWKDEYIGLFVRQTDRRAPEINRGYFARVRGVEMCIEKFVEVCYLIILFKAYIAGSSCARVGLFYQVDKCERAKAHSVVSRSNS